MWTPWKNKVNIIVVEPFMGGRREGVFTNDKIVNMLIFLDEP